MNKILLVIVAMAALGVGGWYGFQRYQLVQAQHAQQARTAAAEAKQRALQAANEAKQRAARAAADATRREVEAQLKPMRVTSVLPGQPSIVIIDKKEYAEGESLTLPQGGKSLLITRVQEDGILLAYNGLTFRLDPPAAPDLAALRKGK